MLAVTGILGSGVSSPEPEQVLIKSGHLMYQLKMLLLLLLRPLVSSQGPYSKQQYDNK